MCNFLRHSLIWGAEHMVHRRDPIGGIGERVSEHGSQERMSQAVRQPFRFFYAPATCPLISIKLRAVALREGSQ